MSHRSVRRERSSSSSSSWRSAPNLNQNPGNDQNQPPVYCVVNNSPLIISSENQPRLTKLTEKPVYLYHAGGTGSCTPQPNRSNDQSSIYSPIPNSSGNVQYPLAHLNISHLNSPDVTNRQDVDARSNYSLNDSRSNISLSQGDSQSDISTVDCRIDVESKDESPRKRRSQRPWRGYVVEEEEKEKNFQSVGINAYYIQEAISDSDTAVSISSATDKLLGLHSKFAAHRKFINDGRPLCTREKVDPAIPYNEEGSQCDNCECDPQSKKIGVHHDKFPKEAIPRCDQYSNNANMLYHYRLIITPETNFVTRDPTTIYYDGKDFWFEGYSIFTHVLIDDIPPYTFTRNFIDYTVRFIRVDYIPSGFCIKDLDIVSDYFFDDIMELMDWKRETVEKNCCRRFHFMPRFVHRTQDLTTEPPKEVSEILSMGEVMQYLIESCTSFTDRDSLKSYTHEDWKEFAKEKHGTLITNLRNKPRTIRVDDVSHYGMSEGKKYPDVIHLTPKFKEGAKLDMKEYGNLCAKLTKAKRAVKSRAIPKREDQKLVWTLAEEIQKRKEIRGATKWVDISFTSRKYLNTGLRWDVSQHASYLPALTSYLRFMLCTSVFEHSMNYKFKDKSLLRVALTHPSHIDTASYSTFIWNMLQNVGKQYPHVEKRRRQKVPLIGAKKKGVIYMSYIMANLYQEEETRSPCRHNERLEFLGDAILDYVSSLHLFLMFPEKGPGKLTAFRSGIVQTEHLADLSKKIGLDQFILVQHRVAELTKSESYLGNALEAIVGAVFLDGGITAVDNLLSFLLFIDDVHLCKVWNNLKKHPLQDEQPETDRHMIEKSDVLKRFVHLENQIGIEFKHIRLLAKAFTQSVHGLHDPKLTGGNYERLEFLGDAILKYVSSDYLYRHFPTHQEGHLTLLRSSLVNSRCLAQAARELGLNNFIIFQSYRESAFMKEKVCSDVFEALLGALHIEKGIEKGILYCTKLVEVCILSRLKEFIINQEWLDSKSQLQQCCHSLRDPSNPLKDGKDYFHPVYKRLKYQAQGGVFYFKVAVYVNGKKLGVGEGRSTKEAEKEAAKQALMNNYFEQYAQQKKIIYRKFGRRNDPPDDDSASDEGEAVEVPKRRFMSDDEDGEEDEGEHISEDDQEEIPIASSSTAGRKSSIKREDEPSSSRRRRSRERDGYPSRYRDERRRRSRSRGRDSSRRKSRSRSPRGRYRRSVESTPRKRSREREVTSPASSKKKRSDDRSMEAVENMENTNDTVAKPQMEISLDRWIKEKNSADDPTTKQKEVLSGLDLEAVSSDNAGDEMLEAITSSENGDDPVEYNLVDISSSELGSDTERPRSSKTNVKDEFDFEKLNEEMEKELKNLNSVDKNKDGSVAMDDDLDHIELVDIDLGDIDDNFGDDELEEEEENSAGKSKCTSDDDKSITDSDSNQSEHDSSCEDECEFQEVDVWEADEDDESSHEVTPIRMHADEIRPEIDDISLDTGDLPLEPEDEISSVKDRPTLDLVSEDSLSEIEIY